MLHDKFTYLTHSFQEKKAINWEGLKELKPSQLIAFLGYCFSQVEHRYLHRKYLST
jgi:hypothetical protein